MLRLTRLNGQEFVVNLDVIAYVEKTPDTIVTLLNGERFLVRDKVDDVVAKAIAYRKHLMSGPVVVEAEDGDKWT